MNNNPTGVNQYSRGTAKGSARPKKAAAMRQLRASSVGDNRVGTVRQTNAFVRRSLATFSKVGLQKKR